MASDKRQRKLRVLVATQIFPNKLEPNSAPFNRKQLQALSELAQVEVVAPIPWFPGAALFANRSRAGRLRAVPKRDVIGGLAVEHPKRAYLPKIGGFANGPLATLSYGPAIRRKRNWADVILATWAYPDAWAAVVIGRALSIPVVVKLHGSDINVIAQSPAPRAALRWMLPKAHSVVGVSDALRSEVLKLGVPAHKAVVVRNGVDRNEFRLRDRNAAKKKLGLPLDGTILLYAGRLSHAKGVGDLLQAFPRVAKETKASLVLLGRGELFAECEELARRLPDRVHVVGMVPHDQVPAYMSACDVFTLPSWAEGVPNVVLEATASGRRVVATNVGGIGEVIDANTGTLVPAKSPELLAEALVDELGASYDEQAVAARAAPSWASSATDLLHYLAMASDSR